jgi:hypothetical protein
MAIDLSHKTSQIDEINLIGDKSYILKWLVDNEKKVGNNWKKIAQEVYSRKSLILSSAKDLQEQTKIEESIVLAATDVFVEKAQKLLTTRGRWLFAIGTFIAIISFASLLYAAHYIASSKLSDLLEGYKLDSKVLTWILIKSTSASAFIFAAIYFLVSLARALLHEATVLYNRRHALRFGRLYVYTKKGKVNLKDLESAFKWNAEFTTAFKDIQADKISKSIWMKVLELPSDTIKKLIELLKESKEDNRQMRKVSDKS